MNLSENAKATAVVFAYGALEDMCQSGLIGPERKRLPPTARSFYLVMKDNNMPPPRDHILWAIINIARTGDLTVPENDFNTFCDFMLDVTGNKPNA